MTMNKIVLQAKYPGIPPHMWDGVLRYIDHGIKPGNFLTALFSNDLVEAVQFADEENRRALAEWARFLYNDAPWGSWGSAEQVTAWRGLKPKGKAA